jgi:hypothetical protein
MPSRTILGRSVAVAIATMFACVAPTHIEAQTRSAQPPTPPDTLSEPQGIVTEPVVVERAIIFSDRRLGGGDLSGGWRLGFADLTPGAGSLSLQTTYRRWGSKDRYVGEASAGVSMRGYRAVAARFELPRFAQRRMALGTEFRWQDYTQVAYFGTGPDTFETNASQYRLRSSNLVGYVTLRPARWVDIDASIGVLSPTMLASAGPFKRDRPETSAVFDGDPVFSRAEQPAFVTSGISLTADTRDFAGHSLRGGVVHVAATRYSDQDDGQASFGRYEAEVAQFVPLARRRVILAVHGRFVGSDMDEGRYVPFYLQPSLGGHNSLRSYDDHRFHDRNLLSLTVETRVAMMTHVDAAFFVDAGNVAAHAADLNLDRRSYGAGLRLHSRRETLARIDVAHGAEGWRAVFRLTDPLRLSRLARRTAVVPFVP